MSQIESYSTPASNLDPQFVETSAASALGPGTNLDKLFDTKAISLPTTITLQSNEIPFGIRPEDLPHLNERSTWIYQDERTMSDAALWDIIELYAHATSDNSFKHIDEAQASSPSLAHLSSLMLNADRIKDSSERIHYMTEVGQYIIDNYVTYHDLYNETKPGFSNRLEVAVAAFLDEYANLVVDNTNLDDMYTRNIKRILQVVYLRRIFDGNEARADQGYRVIDLSYETREKGVPGLQEFFKGGANHDRHHYQIHPTIPIPDKIKSQLSSLCFETLKRAWGPENTLKALHGEKTKRGFSLRLPLPTFLQ
ncbi:hypothetical protein KC717_01740 [Candidatus Dojkabacteria bacterium]|uniref:Uncharacterized protein n=1 Tax=Candidatus Dojkabacteria bacterium TaxID=2099670 RepID=A0A955L7Y7_9BACT|nr:hypothetical protein [Candidatus Dojkabacteria bacterium]